MRHGEMLVVNVLLLSALAGCRHGRPEVGATVATRVGPPPAAADRVAESLAKRLGVVPTALVLVGWQPVTWADASLGCPEPGALYAQATVPGFRLTFRAPNGSTLEVASDRDGGRWVQCLGARPLRRSQAP
jgi:hypothetical protein